MGRNHRPVAGGALQRFCRRSAAKVPREAAGHVDAERQEPRRAMPASARLGAVPRAARRAAGVAVSEGRMIPVVPSMFPHCSQLAGPEHMETLAVPGVPGPMPARRVLTVCYYSAQPQGTVGTMGTAKDETAYCRTPVGTFTEQATVYPRC